MTAMATSSIWEGLCWREPGAAIFPAGHHRGWPWPASAAWWAGERMMLRAVCGQQTFFTCSERKLMDPTEVRDFVNSLRSIFSSIKSWRNTTPL